MRPPQITSRLFVLMPGISCPLPVALQMPLPACSGWRAWSPTETIALIGAGVSPHWVKVKNPEHPAMARVKDAFR